MKGAQGLLQSAICSLNFLYEINLGLLTAKVCFPRQVTSSLFSNRETLNYLLVCPVTWFRIEFAWFHTNDASTSLIQLCQVECMTDFLIRLLHNLLKRLPTYVEDLYLLRLKCYVRINMT